MSRIISLTLVLALIAALLTGCAKPKTETKQSDQPAAGASTESATTAYQAAALPLPDALDVIQTSVFTGSALFLAVMNEGSATSQTVDQDTGAIYGYRPYECTLYRDDLQTGTLSILEFPVEGVTKPQVNALTKAADGSVWAICQTAESDAEDSAYIWSLVHFAADGTHLGTLRLDFADSSVDTTQLFLSTLALDDAGHFLSAGYDDAIYIFDETGRFLKTLSQDGKYGNLIALTDGRAGILSYAESGGMAFSPIDSQKLDWGEDLTIPIYTWDVFEDPNGTGFYFFDDGTINHYDLDTQTQTKVLALLDCDLDATDLINLQADENGNLHALFNTQGAGVDNAYTLYTLQPVDPATLPEKTVLTLATLSLSQTLRQQIAKFNRENSQYRIEVLDYSQYSEVIASPGSYTEDSSSAILKLNTELLSGNLPDLIDVSGGDLPVAQYAAKGFLEDLVPFLNADSSLSEDMLVSNVIDAIKTGGKLYQMPTSFSVIGAAGRHDVVGGYDAWTLDAMKDAMTKLSPDATIFNVDYTKSSVVYACLASSLDQFVDWKNGTCRFDSDEFRAFLEFANSFPAEFDTTNFDFDEYVSDYRRVGQKQQLLANVSFTGFEDIYYQLEAMDNDADFVGYPGASGGFGCGFMPLGTICMTTACKDKDGAWGFIRSMLSEEVQLQQTAFPILKSAFEKQAEKAMDQEYVTDENGESVLDGNGNPIRIVRYTIGFFSETVDVYAVTPEQYKIVCGLIDSTHSLYSFDQNILDIVAEECGGFFAGAKTIDETVNMIQNRVSLYIAEQK